MPKKLLFVPENLYYGAMKNTIEAHKKGTLAVQKKHKKRISRAVWSKAMEKKKNKSEKDRKRKEVEHD